MREQLRRRRSLEMVEDEGLVEEVLGGGGDVGGEGGSTGGADLQGKTGARVSEGEQRGRGKEGEGEKNSETDLEHDLHLVESAPGLLTGEHLHNEASDGPDVGFEGVGGLTDDFGGHPCEGKDERKRRLERPLLETSNALVLTEDSPLKRLSLVGAREEVCG